MPQIWVACLRSADAAGAACVIQIPRDRSAACHPAVAQGRCGAAETVSCCGNQPWASLEAVLQHAGLWIVGKAEKSGSVIYQVESQGSECDRDGR